MSELIISLVLVSIFAIMMNRVFRISSRYERSDKKSQVISTWTALDRGIDPTEKDSQA